jgi:Tfp pilus assembly protein PilX
MAKRTENGFITMVILMILVLAVIIGAAYLRIQHASN